jgi:hypothetical protein
VGANQFDCFNPVRTFRNHFDVARFLEQKTQFLASEPLIVDDDNFE